MPHFQNFPPREEGLYIDTVSVDADGTGATIEGCVLERNPTGETLQLTLVAETIVPGTYPNAVVKILLSKESQPGVETLRIPINLVVQ